MKETRTHRAVGDLGENAVIRYLKLRGYHILDRNYTVRGGEIDIIATRFSYIVFVEVKTRKASTDTEKYGRAQDAVNAEKRAHIRYAASRYITNFRMYDLKPRFDIAEVYYKEKPSGKLTFHIHYRKEAFL
ncbi:MAG: YraN family protein [Clostridia bacterium]|nr:YraN family protein [Clostridia bacterium]